MNRTLRVLLYILLIAAMLIVSALVKHEGVQITMYVLIFIVVLLLKEYVNIT